MEKPSNHHIIQVFKVSITSNKTYQYHEHPEVVHRQRHNIILLVFLPKSIISLQLGEYIGQIQTNGQSVK